MLDLFYVQNDGLLSLLASGCWCYKVFLQYGSNADKI